MVQFPPRRGAVSGGDRSRSLCGGTRAKGRDEMMRTLPRRGLVRVGLLLVLLSWTGARGEDAKEVTGDLKVMQGNWVSVADDVEATWLVEGTRLKARVHDMDYVCKLK